MSIHHLMEDMRAKAGILDEASGYVDWLMVSELLTLIDYDPQLKRSKRNDSHRNLVVKIAQGKYDRKRAIDLFMHLADRAARVYNARGSGKDTMGGFKGSVGSISKATRMAVAEELRDEFEKMWKKNRKQFAEFVPKKYKGKRMGLRIRS